ncbi:MAG: type III-A CRISPR-associated RAMP protein Csm3 [Dialister sp.]|nr:type III-A CRISPR-associated RAMP protein Csm3 [Dialister sp.]
MEQKQLLGKILIQAELTVETGLHIGGSNDYAPIGAVDSVFVRDPFTRQPIIPGSSVKGKMRTLLAKARNGARMVQSPAEDEKVVRRLFGATGEKQVLLSRLQFSDLFINRKAERKFEKIDTDTYMGEVKFENTIERGTGTAMPRQIERVPRGTTFDFLLIYNIENEEELNEDMEVLAQGFRLLQLDYLGGHGSRGYGRVSFSDFFIERIDIETGDREPLDDLADIMDKAVL